jgi:hypothetical protein
VLAINIISAFRQALEQRGNVYDGIMIPNITSITDCLTFSDEMLVSQMKSIPVHLLPRETAVLELKKSWEGKL